MCGIVGIASRSSVIDLDLLVSMRESLRHRGPDDAGIWRSGDGRVAFGHRRLAIIDLSPLGRQPMEDVKGELCITYNGEIYNYRELREQLELMGQSFRSASDTEVILGAYRAWGVECLKRFSGMFAFGLYDSRDRTLFLARDRAGEKPCYYSHKPTKLLFASELKALMADPAFPRDLDMEALDYYLAYGYVPGGMCILKGVRKLPPGHAALYELETDGFRMWRYWELPEPVVNRADSVEDLSEEFEGLLLDSVRRQLVSDVPVGILLSGGIDSSLVTAMAVRVAPSRVRTFTISLPGHGRFDESRYARIVATHFGTEHSELPAEPATVGLLPTLARQFDEPIADSSMVPTYLVSKLIRQSATVAVGGDGGDELFAGYTLYSVILWQLRVKMLFPPLLRRIVSRCAGALPVGFRGRTYLLSLSSSDLMNVAQMGIYFDYHMRRRLIPRLARLQAYGPESHRARCASSAESTVQQLTRTDFLTYLPDDILVKVDRASMLSSLEVRAPLLDHRVVSFAFGKLPDELRATASVRKVLPRRLAEQILPPTLDLRRKRGFSLPLRRWFKGEWGEFMRDILHDADPQLFDRGVIQDLISGQSRGLSNMGRLFALTIFELWRREYGIRTNGD